MPEEPIHFPSNDQKPNILVTIKCNQLLRFTVYGLVSIVLLAFAITSYISNLNQPPDGFPLNAPIVIEAGTDVRMITEILQEKGVVKSKATTILRTSSSTRTD